MNSSIRKGLIGAVLGGAVMGCGASDKTTHSPRPLPSQAVAAPSSSASAAAVPAASASAAPVPSSSGAQEPEVLPGTKQERRIAIGYGELVVTAANSSKEGEASDCAITLRRWEAEPVQLAVVHDCFFDQLEVEPDNGPWPKSGCGEDYVLFAIPTARGGNACDGYDFVSVLVGSDKHRVETFGGCMNLDSASIDESRGQCRLLLRREPHPGEKGELVSVSMRGLVRKTLPALPKWVSSSAVISVEGKMRQGCHAENYKSVIEADDGQSYWLNGNSTPCEPAGFEAPLRARLRVNQWSDGTQSIDCLSARKL